MDWKESIKNMVSPKKPAMSKTSSLFGEEKKRPNFIREKGVLNWEIGTTTSKKGIVDYKTDHRFSVLRTCYEKIPKVFRAINMRAEFAIQGGFKLIGNESDVSKLEKWKKKTKLDTVLLTIVRNMLVYGNCFVEMVSDGENTQLHFLPTDRMRVIRDKKPIGGKDYFTHEILGYAQMDESGSKVLVEWTGNDRDKIIHFKWNWDGTSAYGVSEIEPALVTLSDKLDAEAVIPRILKFHADARIIYRCGRPETPYNDPQIQDFNGKIEGRVVGGDVSVAGDIEPVIIQPKSNPEIIDLLSHIEQQVDACLNSPAVSLLTGSMDGQTSQTLMDSMERDVKTIQDFLFSPFEQQVFPIVLNKNEVPEIKPNPMNIETFLRLSRTLRQMVGKKQERPILTIDEARKEAGYGPMPEEELKTMMTMGMEDDKDESGEEIQPDGEETEGD